ncbi:MAG: hypothetical protein Q9167_003497 [Letrouitia subvulpina]
MVVNAADEKYQLKFVRAAQMLLFANAICDPPLGQITVVPPNQNIVEFTVLLESSKSFPKQGWETVLWHDGHEKQEWAELALEENHHDAHPVRKLSLNSAQLSKVYRRYFSGHVSRPKTGEPIHFTLKFRTSSSDNWRWVREHCNAQDGTICFQPRDMPKELKDYLQDYSSALSVASVESQTPHTKLWSLKASVKAAEGKTSGYADTSLGTPREYSRWFSLVRIWSPWLGPRHGQGNFSPSEDSILVSFLRRDGLHLVLLAVSGVDEVLTVFKPDSNGNVAAHARNDNTEKGQSRVIVTVGRTCDSAIAAALYHARDIVIGKERFSQEEKQAMEDALDKGVKAEWMENWYDGLTYCTWNALGQDLTERKIFDALDTLKNNDIKNARELILVVTNLIIDDNWQSLDNAGESQFHRGWTDFDANKKGFPKGLKHTAAKIRDDHPNIQHIAVWHALLGYWGGVSPTGNIAKNYKTRLVRKSNELVGGTITVVDEEDVQRMYNDFYDFLLDSNIDSVKTDAQFFLDLIDDADDRRRFMKTYQDAWTIASLNHFSIKAISCMSQTPQILFYTQLPLNKPLLMVRNSDDFFPEIPASHPFHVFTNSYTSLLTSHLNVLPDWDMFQTTHPYSSYHAAARCLSGGPICITDSPGQHNLPVIRAMTAQAPQFDGSAKTIILRPGTVGKTIEHNVYTSYHEARLLRLGSFHGAFGTGTSFLGVFNVSECPLKELVRLNSFPGVREEGEYIVRGYSTGEITAPMRLEDEMAVVNLAIEPKGWEILAAYPLENVAALEQKVAVLGLLGKMTGAAALASSPEIEQEENTGRLKIEVEIKALGVLGVYISTLPALSVADNVMVVIQERGVPPETVGISKASDKVLEIDVETAWWEMGLKTGWANTVKVVVYVK